MGGGEGASVPQRCTGGGRERRKEHEPEGRGFHTACPAGFSPKMGCYVCPGLGAAVRCPGEHRCRQRGWGGGAAPAWHPQPLSLPCRQGGFRELPLIPLVPSLMLEPARWMLFPGDMRPAKLIAPTPAPGAAGLGGGLVFIPPTPPRLESQRLRSLWQPSPSLWLPWPPIPKMTHTHMGGPKHTRDTPPHPPPPHSPGSRS